MHGNIRRARRPMVAADARQQHELLTSLARWEPESGDEVGAWLEPPMRTMWERWREVVARPFPESIGLSHQKPARL